MRDGRNRTTQDEPWTRIAMTIIERFFYSEIALTSVRNLPLYTRGRTTETRTRNRRETSVSSAVYDGRNEKVEQRKQTRTYVENRQNIIFGVRYFFYIFFFFCVSHPSPRGGTCLSRISPLVRTAIREKRTGIKKMKNHTIPTHDVQYT